MGKPTPRRIGHQILLYDQDVIDSDVRWKKK